MWRVNRGKNYNPPNKKEIKKKNNMEKKKNKDKEKMQKKTKGKEVE